MHKQSGLLAFRDRIALVHPVAAEIVGNIEDLRVGEAQSVQEIIRRLDVGTVVPGTTSAIKHDTGASAKRLHTLAKLLQSRLAGGWADVLGAWNVCLRKKNVRSDLDHQGLFP